MSKKKEVEVQFAEGDLEEMEESVEASIPPDLVEVNKEELQLSDPVASGLCARLLKLQNRLASIKAMLKIAEKDVQGRIDRIHNWWGRSLLEYARRVIGSSTPRRTVLPGGVLGLRRKPGRMEVLDREEFARWTKKNKRADLARGKITISDLSGEEMDSLLLGFLQSLPEDMQDRVSFEYSPRVNEILAECRTANKALEAAREAFSKHPDSTTKALFDQALLKMAQTIPGGLSFINDEESVTISDGLKRETDSE